MFHMHEVVQIFSVVVQVIKRVREIVYSFQMYLELIRETLYVFVQPGMDKMKIRYGW